MKRPASRPGRGFSVIELMIALSVLALILLIAAPSFGTMVINARVRFAAEALQNALRLAQATAVQRNRQAVLVLTNDRPSLTAVPAADGVNWLIRLLPLRADSKSVDSAALFIQGGALTAAGGIHVDGAAQTCFNSVGRVVPNSTAYSGSSTGFTAACGVNNGVMNFELSSGTADDGSRRLTVQLRFGGQVRMCTPDATSARLVEGCI